MLAEDGLTLRWAPGRDSSGQLGNVLLYVNGEPYREFGPTEYEAKLGAFTPGANMRSFTLVQKDAAGNLSRHTEPTAACWRWPASPSPSSSRRRTRRGGLHRRQRQRDPERDGAAGNDRRAGRDAFVAGAERYRPGRRDSTTAPQTRLAFSVAGSKRIVLKKTTTITVRIKVSKPAPVTATLRDARSRRLHVWTFAPKPGANVVRLRLPATGFQRRAPTS